MVDQINYSYEDGEGESIATAQRDDLILRLAIPEEICDRLRQAVLDTSARDTASMDQLRLAVGRFTVALRDIGTTPERALIALKTVINNRSFVSIAPHISDWSGNELRQRVSTWCIEAFFRNEAS